MKRQLFTEEHTAVRELARDFAHTHVAPHLERWAATGVTDRDLFAKAGGLGLLGMDVDDKYGGGGMDDFRFNVVLNEELTRVGASAVVMNLCGFNDLIAPYLNQLLSESQKQRWLPGLCAGTLISAIAMTEPGSGSDLAGINTTAVREGDCYRLNGAKTFISNGILADVLIVAAKTAPSEGRNGISLFLVESGMPGFTRGSKLRKIGLLAQDTAELFFENVAVPAENLLGEENRGFSYLMHNLVRERLSIAVTSAASMEVALDEALSFTRGREAFGRSIAEFQTIRFTLAELATEVQVARVFLDRCIAEHVEDTLDPTEAAMAKWWITELQQRVVTRSLQLHGGSGFMTEYRIGREFVDARASTLYGGTTEIMKDIIGKALVRGHITAPALD
ncbi:acyl-CoA dehydrogenase [Rhodococcus sp. 06-156-3C]|uniref:acyl-CoA dehydrogenase family protein n=1 Tax=Nocardiaceae TaxID=85025 RepID=UPI000522F232|nr:MULTISPECIES: acyl-CoA dehydrogenase family protein [Rhodococcus]OZD18190.1 acyl-CoA dehydrogenase [Rhodococcus sp. 06-156-4C]OZD18787.1 acyl-CoA dehydrogenase [Rhodococcus sp. 06-156-3C]OZD22297.1 acyl-CoA dehydrogenase [Rhodococcus sp. 06-156-4a]OZD34103.1 acyl-CoA dehydrogenase [Rhodococcus sp. 06-156-3b]OZD38840.1 acyl-CoA dehydrogenase [Rhodococcus sp. 06-156-3]